MKAEIPVCKRCCFCLPLRYGLLAWGYFKMTADAFIIALMSYSLIQTLKSMSLMGNENMNRSYSETINMIIAIIALIVFFTDFVVTIVFIVGGHKKNVKLIRVFYFFSIAVWVATILLTVTIVILTLQNFWPRIMSSWDQLMIIYSNYFVIIVVQSYFLMLLRSEVIKLRDNGEFRYVSHATEAECTMKCEEKVVGDETETKEVSKTEYVTDDSDVRN